MSLTTVIFLAMFVSCGFLALAKHPIYGIYAYMLAFYGYPPGRWWGANLPDLRWSLTASLITLIAFYLHNAKTTSSVKGHANSFWFASLPVKILIIFTVWLWLQNIWALLPETHYIVSILFTKYLIMFFLFYRILDSEENIYHFCLSHVIGCGYLGWVAYTTASGGRFEGIGSPGIDDANALATHMATGLITAGFLLFRATTRMKVVIVLCTPFILNCIILTQSRGAMLGIVSAGLIGFILKPVRNKKTFYILATIGAMALVYLASGTFIERMKSMQNADDVETMDNSARSRVVLIEAQIKMFQESPILGHGHRGTAALSPFYLDIKWLAASRDGSGSARSSHNTFFTVLVEQGLLGAILYILLVLWTAKTIFTLKRKELLSVEPEIIIYNAIVGCSLGCLLIAGQFADYLKHEVMIWLYVVMLAYMRLNQQTSSSIVKNHI